LEVDNANQIYFGGGDDKLFQLKRDHFRSSLVFQSGDTTTVDIVLSGNGRRLATLDRNAQLAIWNLGDTRAIRANPRFQFKGIVQKIFKSPQPGSEFFYALVADTTILKLCQINWLDNAISETTLNNISIDPASGDQDIRRGLCVDIDSQARFVFIGDPNSNTIWQYDIKENRLIETLGCEDSSPQSLSWIEPEQKLAIHQSSNRGEELIKIDLDSEASETIFVGGDTTRRFLIRQAPKNSGFFLKERGPSSRIQLRDPQGKLVREFDGETNYCGEFKWLDKGKTLVSSLLVDGAIRFWDVETGRERFNIDESPHILDQLDVSDDGTTIAAGTTGTARTGKIFVYRFKPPIHQSE
jgi:WD40 repeat protein